MRQGAFRARETHHNFATLELIKGEVVPLAFIRDKLALKPAWNLVLYIIGFEADNPADGRPGCPRRPNSRPRTPQGQVRK